MAARGLSVTVRCPAKLNLYLEVLGRRPDGYHEIDTIIQAIDLYDDLHIEPAADLSLECDDPALPADETNLVLRAAVALRQATGHRGGARFRLAKRIPTQAGLGGGSSDAAGTLVGLNQAWGLGLSARELGPLAATVGSDVPFFLTGGTARCTGRGERVEPLGVAEELCYVLVCPPMGVSTAQAYGKLRFPLTASRASATMLIRNLAEGRVDGVGARLYNRLEAPAFAVEKALPEAKRRLVASGRFLGVAMTGSGSGLFGLCRPGDSERARQHIATMNLGETRRVRSIGSGVSGRPA